ncbi:uncharacterized protein K02A2.6-like [Frankliniella occidentalis]|uniref:RNA-directed DNA polymerase n=1 Tax=Frankliniella occidentalis TaxID=133901 RepID=A0A9C6X8V2_FRAOC|nr:uncharacterized protein K02A2.6-like [Frankliniella occidentalis]
MATNVSSANVRRPGVVNLRSGNIQASWSKFKQKFEIFLLATQQEKATSTVRFALLLGEAGDDALEVYDSFKDRLITYKKDEATGLNVVDQDLSRDYESVLREFDLYATEKKCVIGCRELFNHRNQKAGEPVANWLTDLRNLSKDCKYGSIEESMIHDRLIWGTYDKELRKTLRAKAALPLHELVEISKSTESNAKYPRTVERVAVVDSVQTGPMRGRAKKRTHQQTPYEKPQQQRGKQGGGSFKQNRKNQKPLYTYKCRKCLQVHEAGNCPAWGHTCKVCGKPNHFPVVHRQNEDDQLPRKRQKTTHNEKPHVQKINALTVQDVDESTLLNGKFTSSDDDSDGQQVKYVHSLTKSCHKEYLEELRINGKDWIVFKLDCGSQANVLPMDSFQFINSDNDIELSPTRTLLEGYDESICQPEGSVMLKVETKYGRNMLAKFYISKKGRRAILGIEGCEILDLVKRVEHSVTMIDSVEINSLVLPDSKESFLNKFNEQFTGLGQFKQKVTILVDPTVQPRMCPPRRYNFSIINRLKDKLDELERRGVVAKITTESPKFVSNLVIREKSDGDLRICLDPQVLNTAIVRQTYAIPTQEELAYRVRDKAVFTVLDLREGFWHASLDEDSSLLCTFSTPHGLYKFLKMPFGLTSAPEIFQFLAEQAFQDTDVILYFDDCLVAGKDFAEHDKILAAVMQRAKEQNIRFNPSKIQYRQAEVKFLGHLWSKNNIRVDPQRVRAINAIAEPKSKNQLQKCLGTFNYLRNFIPQMAEIAAPLNQLLSSSVAFHWLPVHSQAFQALKDSISKAPVLATFDCKKPIILQADASQFGLGCCLLQGRQPVVLASRRLTETETNYAQIEKEMLALVFAAEKFEKYIWGMPDVLFQTDHQPLVSIFKKPIYTITNNRLKKMRLKLLRFQPRVEYLPGKLLYIADLLSRNFLDDPVEDDPEMVEYVHEVTKNIPMSSDMKDLFLKETSKDTGLSTVMQYYQEGWPKHRNKVPMESKPYWGIRNDLFVEDGLVIINDRIVVPVVLRPKVLKRLHAAHLGMDKTKSRARQSVYWPGITNDIETLIGECRICERHSPQNFKEPLIPHEIPQLRFQKVSVDIMELDTHTYLVLVDNLSKWLEIKPLTSKSSKSVIGVLRSIFATHGVPEIIFGDNNPLNSAECHEFAKSIGSEVRTSSPEYPRSNGLAEKGVHIAKQLIKKCTDEGTHYLDSLREYNNTPLSGMNVSPSQILMSRICRTGVPTLHKNLEPKVINVHPTLKRLQGRVKSRHDAHARRKPVTFKVGNNVAVRRGNKWIKATIIAKIKADRSYLVRQSNGKVLRRNTWHLKHSRTESDHIDSDSGRIDVEHILDNFRAQKTIPLKTGKSSVSSLDHQLEKLSKTMAQHGLGDV